MIKPTSESGGKGVFIGPQASAAEREQQARLIEDEPHRFIAQELVHLSTAPTETATASSPPATSTCGRSRCSARRSGSSPAG